MNERVATVKLSKLLEKSGIRAVTYPASMFGGEHNKTGWHYVVILWMVSIWAMITNVTQAVVIKLVKKDKRILNKILWELGRDKTHVSSFLVDKLSHFNHQSKWGAAGWKSLELFYNYHEAVSPKLKSNIEGVATKWWGGLLENRQAITNRKKIVVDLLTKAFTKFSHEPEIRLLSIASGSAQAVVEALLLCPTLNIKVTLVDLDNSALAEAQRLISENGLSEKFTIIRGTPKKANEVCKTFRPHIIEMVGFMDYLTKEKAINLIQEIRGNLSLGGVFITCNIKRISEKIFLDWVLLWPMIYRTQNELAEVLLKGGFGGSSIELIYEPFHIHGIANCIKSNELAVVN